MSNIIVTTPKSEIKNAAAEAEDAKKYGGDTRYFRRFPLVAYPKVAVGDRVYYVEDGFIRGFAIVDDKTCEEDPWECDTTGREYQPGIYLWMRADSWQWIEPIPFVGFQGFRYIKQFVPHEAVKIVGGWLDSKPEPGKAQVAA